MMCTHCHGTGFRARDVDGVRRVERCECWRQQVALELLKDAKIPPRYHKCDFSSFVTYPNEQLLRTVKKARVFVDAFSGRRERLAPDRSAWHRQDSPRGGRACARSCSAKGFRGLYFDTRTLLSTIRSTYNPVTRASEADVLGRVMAAGAARAR